MIDILRLPLSGAVVQFRSGDHAWRLLPATSASDDDVLLDENWRYPGDDAILALRITTEDENTVWVLAGELPRSRLRPRVELEDGTVPVVARVGRAWVAEWTGQRRRTSIITPAGTSHIAWRPRKYEHTEH